MTGKIDFDFEQALEDLKQGKGLSGKDGILTPLIKQLTEAAFYHKYKQRIGFLHFI